MKGGNARAEKLRDRCAIVTWIEIH